MKKKSACAIIIMEINIYIISPGRKSALKRGKDRKMSEKEKMKTQEKETDGRRIDLHTHSTCSDGSMRPAEVVQCAKEHGLCAMALSDHDTVAGVEEAMQAGKKLGVEVIPAIELSAQSETETHMLGYFVDVHNRQLHDTMRRVIEVRQQRSQDNCDALRRLGFDVTMEEAAQLAGGEMLCRAHFARLLVNKGYCSSVKEAFDVYLGVGKPAYSSRQALTDIEAIELIHEAGGIAVAAHLNQMKRDDEHLDAYIRRLKEAGLDGVEGYYTEYTPDMFLKYNALARKYDLIISGGSDFHGAMKPHITIGKGTGNLSIPYSVLEGMKQYYQLKYSNRKEG